MTIAKSAMQVATPQMTTAGFAMRVGALPTEVGTPVVRQQPNPPESVSARHFSLGISPHWRVVAPATPGKTVCAT
jgi:hypothetical protein